MRQKLNMNEKGFTFIEVMIATAVIALVLLSILSANTLIQQRGEVAAERSIAIQDANEIFERMRNTSATGTFPTNVTAAYPNNGAVAGFNNLSNEQVVVSYVNTAANPLDATITVTWQERGTRNATQTLRTVITQR